MPMRHHGSLLKASGASVPGSRAGASHPAAFHAGDAAHEKASAKATHGLSQPESRHDSSDVGSGDDQDGTDGGDDETKRLRRMLSNRESARRSRRRKQAHLGELQEKVDALSGENERMLRQLHALHASFNGVMQRNRVVKQNTAYLRAHLVSGEPPTREVLEAATVAMNAGAQAEQMLRVVAAGNGLAPASVGELRAGGDGGNAFMAGGAHALNPAAAAGREGGRGKKVGAGRGRATNFPVVAAGSRGRGSETSSLTYVPQVGGHRETNASKKGGAGKCSPNVSMQSVDTKSYANAVKTSRLSRADADAALAAVDMHAMDMHESPSGANLDRHEAALAAAVAAHLAVPGGDAGARAPAAGGGGANAHAQARSLAPRDFDLPGGAASASAAAAVAAQCGLGAQQGSDGSRADTGGGSSGDGSDGAAYGGEGNGSGDVGAQSTRAPTYGLTDDAVKDHHHREMVHDFLAEPGASGKPILEHGAAGGEDRRRDDDEDETDALGTFQDWIVEDGSLGSGDPMKGDPLDTRLAAQKMGRTDSMNRVASMERMAKRSARGDAA